MPLLTKCTNLKQDHHQQNIRIRTIHSLIGLRWSPWIKYNLLSYVRPHCKLLKPNAKNVKFQIPNGNHCSEYLCFQNQKPFLNMAGGKVTATQKGTANNCRISWTIFANKSSNIYSMGCDLPIRSPKYPMNAPTLAAAFILPVIYFQFSENKSPFPETSPSYSHSIQHVQYMSIIFARWGAWNIHKQS